jgi:hypothetical protein
MLLGVNLFAQYIQVTFRDILSPYTTNSRILEENPSYGVSPLPAVDVRWIIQLYKTTDSVIDPLDGNGNPTNDDVMVTDPLNLNATQYLVVLDATGRITTLAIRFYPGTSQASQGDKVYLRIFNAHTIASATKYIEFLAPYTVPVANYNLEVDPTYAWTAWINKSVTPLVSGTITSGLPVNGVTVTCTGLPPIVTTASGTFGFSVNPGSNITITPTKSGYFFTPASYTFTNVQEAISNVNFVMTKSAPNTATNPVPANSASGVNPTIGLIAWDYIPLDGYSLPTGFKVYFPDNAAPVFVPYSAGVTHYTFGIPLLAYNTIYGWKVVPTNDNPGKGKADPSADRAMTGDNKADAGDIITWSFTTKNTSYITPGISEYVDPDGPGALGTFVFNTPSTEVVPTTPVIEYALVPVESVPFFPGQGYPLFTQGFAMNLSTFYTTDHSVLSVTPPAGTWYALAYYGGTWHEASPYPTTGGALSWPDIPFTQDVQLVFSGGWDPTLPVELSSFTAVYTAGFFVQLTWVVQSETNHLGYYVMRNSSEDLNSAVQLNVNPISGGTAAGTQITYSFRDDQIDYNTTYYYWLQSVSLDNQSQFFGPISVVVGNGAPEEPTPLVPVVTALLDAYPNPFNPNTTIPYTLKEAGDVKIEIYNLKGQIVWTYTAQHDKAGFYKTPWLGKDQNGKPVSSGVYYYRMTSGKYTASKKIVLVK